MTTAIFGSTGFIGRAITDEARQQGVATVAITLPRVVGSISNPSRIDVAAWLARNDSESSIVELVAGCDAAISAGGLADAASSDHNALWAANVLLPAIAAEITKRANVSRFVQISSAAVQGRRRILDDSTDVSPLTPYARSKAHAEQLILGRHDLDTVVYRPTSVQGAGRQMTATLRRLGSLPIVPVVHGGDRTIPFALVENVAAIALELASRPGVGPIVLHPDEEIRVRDLLDWFAPRPLRLSVPEFVAQVAVAVGHLAGRASSRTEAVTRRCEILLLGQRLNARTATAAGLRLPYGRERWEELAAAGAS